MLASNQALFEPISIRPLDEVCRHSIFCSFDRTSRALKIRNRILCWRPFRSYIYLVFNHCQSSGYHGLV